VGQTSTIGVDIAKHVFQVHRADSAGRVLFRRRVTRVKVIGLLAAQRPCVVAMKACAGAHYWAREISKLGHCVRLIAPAYVKPFVKRQKNDVADAEAICEAAQRPSMRFVSVKTEEQQANGIVFRARNLLVRQSTQCVNALRGHLFEYGYTFPQGINHVASLVALIEDPRSSLPESAQRSESAGRHLHRVGGADRHVGYRDYPKLEDGPDGTSADDDPGCRTDCLDGHYSLGTGRSGLRSGKQRLGAVSKRGEQTIRRLLIIGASAVVQQASRRGAAKGSWLAQMLAPKPKDAGHRRASQQDGPHRLSPVGQRRRLQSSGSGGVADRNRKA